ncbi:MAG TPA: serine protein kinase, partial [Myxococcota bacterium]|nr:serine protein kinase [Myxococcota bacterium]
MSYPDSLLSVIASLQDKKEYENLHWEGTFDDYLKIVREDPKVTRTSFQRLYDMIMGFGRKEYIDSKKKIIHYNFFDDPIEHGKDAIFGLDIPLMRLVNVIKSAALGYGTERRVILLHGPVGSSKSTIARLLKKGIEHYSRTPDGRLYTFAWHMPKELHQVSGGQEIFLDPLHEEPLKLLPSEMRERAMGQLKLGSDQYPIRVKGDLNPASRHIFRL